MADSSQGPITPYTFECTWEEDKFRYTERAVVPDGLDAGDVANTTEQKMMLDLSGVEFPDGVQAICGSEPIKAGDEVVAMIEIRPGRPDGFEDVPVRVLCAELMTQIASKDKEDFEALVEFAKTMSGDSEYEDELLDDVTPELPDEY
jgi:hypothetical protein